MAVFFEGMLTEQKLDSQLLAKRNFVRSVKQICTLHIPLVKESLQLLCLSVLKMSVSKINQSLNKISI